MRAAAALALLAAGCGAASMYTSKPMPATHDEAREEISSLEARIAYLNERLGVAPATPEPARGDERPPPAARAAQGVTSPYAQQLEDHDGAIDQPTAPAAPGGTAPAPPPAARPEAMPPPPTEAPRPTMREESVHATATTVARVRSPRRRSRRCDQVDEAAREICDASARICRIADSLAEDGARESCARSRDDCQRAHDYSRSCD